jgi:hypothetical protein
MKKRILLFTLVAGIGTVVLTSGQNGAGAESGYNATGSETGHGNINGCKAAGCHGTTATTGITVKLELDSAGVPRHYYTPGITYTVKITGTNTTSAANLTHFGFQVSCITGSSAVATPTNAGTFASTGLPSGVRYTPAILTPTIQFVCNLIEHNTPIAATTGTGGTGTTYVESFQWTAPVAGTGTISFWGALNAVDFNHAVTGDFWNTTNLVVTEGHWSVTSVASIANEVSFKAYPNPVSNSLNLQSENAGTYNVHVYDLNGRIYANEQVSGLSSAINTSNWTPGLYQVVLEKDGNRQVIPVVKN